MASILYENYVLFSSQGKCIWKGKHKVDGGGDVSTDAVCHCAADHFASLTSNRTILLAGHETSATSLCWVLLEIAKHPDVQKRLREEIRAMEQAIHARGDVDFTATDLDGMPYLSAVIKVSSTFIISSPVAFSWLFLGINALPSCCISELSTSGQRWCLTTIESNKVSRRKVDHEIASA